MDTDKEITTAVNQAEWEVWLEKNLEKAGGIWLRIYKKDSGIPTVSYDEAVESGLCFGWIDGQKGTYDDISYIQRFTPRRARSLWSKINTLKVDQLVKDGRMRPSGIAQIETAKADGRWHAAYDSAKNIQVPEDFAKALAEQPVAHAFFTRLSQSNRYAILFRIQTAKKPETRTAWITRAIEMCAKGETFHP